jgi:hypothetical protein
MLAQMKGCLADGFPFVFGFTACENFESAEVAKTGEVQLPGPREGVVGGHAVLAVGYDDKITRFIVGNSWAQAGARKAILPCPTLICSLRILQTTFGQFAWCISLARPIRLTRCQSIG